MTSPKTTDTRTLSFTLVVRAIGEHAEVMRALAAVDAPTQVRTRLDHLAALRMSSIFRLLLARMRVISDVHDVVEAWEELGLAIAPLPETSSEHRIGGAGDSPAISHHRTRACRPRPRNRADQTNSQLAPGTLSEIGQQG